MSKIRSWLFYWLPVVVWMCLIFSASGDTQSFQHSSRIVAPFVHWLFPHISERGLDRIVFLARKGAHLTEYAVLAWLLWRAFHKPVRRDPRPWSWRIAGRIVLIVMLYAATDEFHQSFVPSREPTVRDVLIDTTGAIFGLLLLWLPYTWRSRRHRGRVC